MFPKLSQYSFLGNTIPGYKDPCYFYGTKPVHKLTGNETQNTEHAKNTICDVVSSIRLAI